MSHELHPGVLQYAGLVAALQSHCAEFGSQHGITVTLSDAAGLDAIPPDIALCLYRVTQEALRNIATHTGAHQAEVTLRPTADGLELTIADDGQGFRSRRGDGEHWRGSGSGHGPESHPSPVQPDHAGHAARDDSVVLIDTLQFEHLDGNEVRATLDALLLAISQDDSKLKSFRD